MKEFFNQPTNSEHAELIGTDYLNEFMKKWLDYYDAKKNGDEKKAEDILSIMIHSIETNKPITDSDKYRINEICWEVMMSHEPMHRAFVNLLK